MRALIFEHEEQIKLFSKKYNYGVIESWITAAPGLDLKVFKDALKFISTPLLGIARRRVVLLEEEAKAPGKELAYIVKARNKFGNTVSK